MDIKELLAKQEEMRNSATRTKTEKLVEKTKVLTFNIGVQTYGIELQFLREIIGVPPITVIPGLPSYILGIINVRSKAVPVISLRKRFGKEEIPYNEKTCTVIVSVDDVQVGIIVDSVQEVIPVYEKNIANSPERTGVNDNKFIKYLIELEDGVKLILDVKRLLYDGEHHFRTEE